MPKGSKQILLGNNLGTDPKMFCKHWFSCSLTSKWRGCACKYPKMVTKNSIFLLLLLFLGATQADIAIKENIGQLSTKVNFCIKILKLNERHIFFFLRCWTRWWSPRRSAPIPTTPWSVKVASISKLLGGLSITSSPGGGDLWDSRGLVECLAGLAAQPGRFQGHLRLPEAPSWLHQLPPPPRPLQLQLQPKPLRMLQHLRGEPTCLVEGAGRRQHWGVELRHQVPAGDRRDHRPPRPLCPRPHPPAWAALLLGRPQYQGEGGPGNEDYLYKEGFPYKQDKKQEVDASQEDSLQVCQAQFFSEGEKKNQNALLLIPVSQALPKQSSSSEELVKIVIEEDIRKRLASKSSSKKFSSS